MQLAQQMKKCSWIHLQVKRNKLSKKDNLQTNDVRYIKNGHKMDVIKPLQQCTICSKMFQFKFKCWLKDHMKLHSKAEAQICSVCKIQFRRIDLSKKQQTECNFSNSNKNIGSYNIMQ